MGEPIFSPFRQNWGRRSSLRRAEQPYDSRKSREEIRGPEGDASVCPSPLFQLGLYRWLLEPPRRTLSVQWTDRAQSPVAAGVGPCDQSRTARV